MDQPIEPTPPDAAVVDAKASAAPVRATGLLDSVLLEREATSTWFRHEVRRLFLLHLLAAVAVVAVGVAGALWRFGRSTTDAVTLGALAGIAIGALWSVTVTFVVPLTVTHVRRLLASPPEYVLVRAAPVATSVVVEPGAEATRLDDVWEHEPATVVDAAPPVDAEGTEHGVRARSRRAVAAREALLGRGFVAAATVRTDERDADVVDLYHDGALAVAAVDRSSGELTVLTELAGFRVAMSTALVIPPTDELVVNVVAGGSPVALLESHHRLVSRALSTRALPSDPVGLYKLARRREVEGFRGLGPWLGAVLDRRSRTGRPRLSATPSAGAVLLHTGNRVFRDTN